MCGITGILNFKTPADTDPVRRMTGTLTHRGPDDVGVFSDGPIALGHRRLSILDLSPAGHQPMSTPDRALWLVYNGEIYNYRHLRVELE
ncbi:MAG: asparagine synthetase B, partial [Chloroflexi bacterium]